MNDLPTPAGPDKKSLHGKHEWAREHISEKDLAQSEHGQSRLGDDVQDTMPVGNRADTTATASARSQNRLR
eukprot:3853704-Pleurochrysis_carterae.AAC.1